MTLYLLIACLVATLADWIAVFKSWRKVEIIAKPAVIILLLGWYLANIQIYNATLWFAVGLVCSLVGDVMHLLPRLKSIGGFLAFLLTLLFYNFGFNKSLPVLGPPTIIAIIMIVFLWGGLFLRLAMQIGHGVPRLMIPISLYTALLSLMLASSVLNLFKPGWDTLAALLASLGAVSFALSDYLLIQNRYISPNRFGRLPEMVSYHIGQILIISGIILQYR